MKTVNDVILDKRQDLYVDLVRRWQDEKGVHNRRPGKLIPIDEHQAKAFGEFSTWWDEQGEAQAPAKGLTRAMVLFLMLMALALCGVLVSLGCP